MTNDYPEHRDIEELKARAFGEAGRTGASDEALYDYAQAHHALAIEYLRQIVEMSDRSAARAAAHGLLNALKWV